MTSRGRAGTSPTGSRWAADEGVDVINASLRLRRAEQGRPDGHVLSHSRGSRDRRRGGNAGRPAPALSGPVPGCCSASRPSATAARSHRSRPWTRTSTCQALDRHLSTTLRRRTGLGLRLSMATAHVSGVAALVTAPRPDGPATMADRLMGTATDAGPPGRDDAYGAGA